MSALQILRATAWSALETLRQAMATRVFWLMLGASAVCVVFCLGVRLDGDRPLKPDGEIELIGGDGKPLSAPDPKPCQLRLAFGAVRVGAFRDGRAEIQLLLVLLGKWIAGGVGTLAALVCTSGLLADSLRPDAAAVLFTKPAPRWGLLLGKFLGSAAFVALQATAFVGGTWLALGLSTGHWFSRYLLCLPLLLVNFSFVYAVAALIAVCTRNSAACVAGASVFWFVSFGTNLAHHLIANLPPASKGARALSPLSRGLGSLAYWIMPKPADLTVLFDQALGAGAHFRSAAETLASRPEALHPMLSVATTLLFAGFILAAAGRQLDRLDY